MTDLPVLHKRRLQAEVIGPIHAEMVAAEVTVIDTATLRAGPAIRLPDGASGVRSLEIGRAHV